MEEDDASLTQSGTMENGRDQRTNGTVKTDEESARKSRSSSLSLEGDKMSTSETASPADVGSTSRPSKNDSKSLPSWEPVLFNHSPDVTEEASRGFAVLSDCVYASKSLGNSDQENLDCDCEEDWHDGINHACGEESDCINRVTKIECVGTNCGDHCQNQRFQRKQYAKVSVIKTEKKGYGLRADADLEPNDFVFEYIGEVIGEELFRSRMMKYDEKGLKHFYFMSLTRTEYVDATKKGNLGRFCNHSCNPNCYVDKWVVGEKLRMGIFALRTIKAGEELCFNYNVDRYGANPQECHCGEPNCTKILGGKTQTERATKLPLATLEALGIDDGDHWEASVASKKPRKKKASESDEEYVNSIQPRDLEEDEVGNVMSALRSCKDKWIAVRLLQRIQDVEEERVLRRVVKFHGYEYLKTTLNTFKDDDDAVLQVLEILHKLPRMTRNKIDDAKIEPVIESLTSSEHQDVAAESKRLLEVWKPLEVGYRIPRAKADQSAQQPVNSFFDDRRQQAREAAAAPIVKVPSPVRNAPTGPRNSIPQRNPNQFILHRRRPPPRDADPLPTGWCSAIDQKTGLQYYWEASNPGERSWVRPTAEASKSATSVALQAQKIQDIIAQCAQPTPRPASTSHTPQAVGTPVSEPKREKWRSWPMEKQQKLYENTIFPYVKHVADKFYKKLPKDDLKKFVKEINKNLVVSDYKHNRVEDPSKISERQQSKVKKYTKDFLEKAVMKHEQREKERAARRARRHAHHGAYVETPAAASDPNASFSAETSPTQADHNMMSDGEPQPDTPDTTPDLKRKREDDADSLADLTPADADTPFTKRVRETEPDVDVPSPPPPPTPPPLDELEEAVMIEEEQRLQEHEDVLRRENEEAKLLQKSEAEQRKLREHEEALERENQEALLALQQKVSTAVGHDEDTAMVNGAAVKTNGIVAVNGTKLGVSVAIPMNLSDDCDNSNGETDVSMDSGGGANGLEMELRKREVLGH